MITSPVRESKEQGLELQEGDNYSSTDCERGEQTAVNGLTESDNARDKTVIEIENNRDRDRTVIQTIPQIEHREHKNCLVSSIEVDVETSRQVAVAITNSHKLNNVR